MVYYLEILKFWAANTMFLCGMQHRETSLKIKLLLLDVARDQVSAFLPEALRKTLESYHEYMKTDISAENFVEMHKNAKVAISHVELLIKLAKWVDQSRVSDDKPLIPQEIILMAEEDIAAFRGEG